MKKFFSLIVLNIVSIAVFGMSYSEARQQALFLTDKMAYELNLNTQQYNDCYEINLDYLMGVVAPDDVYGSALDYRNADLRHILYDWQYDIFCATDYFFRPLRWIAGAWSYPIYRIYDAARFFFGRPGIYASYRGGHGRYFYAGGYYGARRPVHWDGGMRGYDVGPGRPHHHHGYSIGGPREHHGYPTGGPREHRGYHIDGPRGGHGGHGRTDSYNHGRNDGYHNDVSGNRGHHNNDGRGNGYNPNRSDNGHNSHSGRSSYNDNHSNRGSYSDSRSHDNSRRSMGSSGNSYNHSSSTRMVGGGSSSSRSGSSGGSYSGRGGSHGGGGRSGSSRGGR